jgi:hypothetical protein
MIGVYPFLYGMAVAAVVILIMGLFFKLPDWKIGLMILVVAALGFSVNVYTPVRSARQPIINMNNPSKDLATTVAFLERKQYGSVSMVERPQVRDSVSDWRVRDMGDCEATTQVGTSAADNAADIVGGIGAVYEFRRRYPAEYGDRP